MATIDYESKWDERIKNLLVGDPNLLVEIPAANILVQGESFSHIVDEQFILINSDTSILETQMSNQLEEEMTIELIIKNINWDNRTNILKMRRIILIIGKILLSNTLNNNEYRLAFTRGDIEYDIQGEDYPNGIVRMRYTIRRVLDPIIS